MQELTLCKARNDRQPEESGDQALSNPPTMGGGSTDSLTEFTSDHNPTSGRCP